MKNKHMITTKIIHYPSIKKFAIQVLCCPPEDFVGNVQLSQDRFFESDYFENKADAEKELSNFCKKAENHFKKAIFSKSWGFKLLPTD